VQALMKLAILARINGFKSHVTTFASARTRSNTLTPGAKMSRRSFDVAPRVQRLRCDRNTDHECGTSVYACALSACRVRDFEYAESIRHT